MENPGLWDGGMDFDGGGGGFEIRPSLVEVEAGQRKRH
jgi:hypothetical protein